MGPAMVTWESLRAWRLELGLTLDPWEVRTLVRLGYRRAVIEGEQLVKESKKPAANGIAQQVR